MTTNNHTVNNTSLKLQLLYFIDSYLISYHHILPLVWCIYAYNACLISPLCTAHMALPCDIYMSLPASMREKIPYLAASEGGHDYLFIHRTGSKAWFIVAVFFACQKIRRNNLAPVTPHYSRQWNTRDSCVTPLWSKHKRPSLGAVQAEYGYYCHTATERCGAPQVAMWDDKRQKELTTNDKHVNCCVAQVEDVTNCYCH